MIRIKKRNFINQICWYILLFFGLFDAARNYTYLPFWIGYLKDSALFILLLVNFRKIRIDRKIGNIFYIMMAIICLFSIQGVFNSRYNVTSIVIGIVKYLEFFLMIILFQNWNNIFPISLNQALKQYVYVGVPILIVVNVIGYYIPNPIVSRLIWNGRLAKGYYGGRITVGQPPIAIYPVLVSFVYLLIFDRKIIRLVIYMSAILLAVTNTGIVAIVAVISVIGVYEVFIEKEKNTSRKIIGIICILILMVIIVFPFFKSMLPEQWDLYEKKIVAFLTGGVDASMKLREVHWKGALATIDTNLDKIFGKGLYGYYNTENQYDRIENMYVSIYCGYGLWGFAIWILMWIEFLKRDISRILKKREKEILLSICSTVIYMLHMYTLDTLIVYMITFSFALFYTSTHQEGNSLLEAI